MRTMIALSALALASKIILVSGDQAYSETVNLYNEQMFDKVPEECLTICYDLEIVDSGANGWDGGEINLQVWAEYSSVTSAPVSECDLIYDSWEDFTYSLAHTCDRVGDPYKLASGTSETSEICFADPSISGCEMYDGVCYSFNLADWLDNAGKYDNPYYFGGVMYFDAGEGGTADQHAEAGWSLKDKTTGDVIAENTGLSTTSVCVDGVTRAPTMTPTCYQIAVGSIWPAYPWDTNLVISPKEGTTEVPGFNAMTVSYTGSGETEYYEWCTPGEGEAVITVEMSTWEDYCEWALYAPNGVEMLSGSSSGAWAVDLGAPTTLSPTQAPTNILPSFAPTNTPAPTVATVDATLTMESYRGWGDYISLEISHQTHRGKVNGYGCNPTTPGEDCVETLALQNEGCFDATLVTKEAVVADPVCYTLRLNSEYPNYGWDNELHIEAATENTPPGFVPVRDLFYSGSGSYEDHEWCTPQDGQVDIVVTSSHYENDSLWTLLDPNGNEIVSGKSSDRTTVTLSDRTFEPCLIDETANECLSERLSAKYRITLGDDTPVLVAYGEGVGSTSSFCLPWDSDTVITMAPTVAPIEDCNGVGVFECYPYVPAYEGDCARVLGDGKCEDTELNPSEAFYDFNCAEYNFDGGDCDNLATSEVCTVEGVATSPASKSCCAALGDVMTALGDNTDASSVTAAFADGNTDLICDFLTMDGCFHSVASPLMEAISADAVQALKDACGFYSAAPTFSPTQAPTISCEGNLINDCDGACVSADWSGDNTCDERLNCVELNFDEGDCARTKVFTDCDGIRYSDYECLTQFGEPCEEAQETMKNNGQCNSEMNCQEHDYDNDDCGFQQCTLSGVDLGLVTPRCCDALMDGGEQALAGTFSLADYISGGWCGKHCGHSSVVGLGLLDLLTGSSYKEDFIDLCHVQFGIDLSGGLAESGVGDAYTGEYDFDLNSGFSLADGVEWPASKTFSKSVSAIMAAFEMPIDVPTVEVNDILQPMAQPLDFTTSLIAKFSTSSGLSVDQINEAVFIEIVDNEVSTSTGRRLEDVMCNVFFQDIGVVSEVCCTKIDTAANVLVVTRDPEPYADFDTCQGSCYEAISYGLNALAAIGIGDYTGAFDKACEDKGFEPGAVPTPNPTPAPTTEFQTAAPTSSYVTLTSRIITSFKYDYGTFTTEGGTVTKEEKVAEVKSMLETAVADEDGDGEVTLLDDYHKIITIDMKTKDTSPTADDMDCLFQGSFSLGETSHECCLILNTLAPLVLNRGFDDTDFGTSAIFANAKLCSTCADVALATLEALEDFPFNQDNLVQPFVDACYDSFDDELAGQYSFSTMAPTPSTTMCNVGDNSVGHATPSCCSYLRSNVADLATNSLDIETFVEEERDMLCEQEEDDTCFRATTNMFNMAPDIGEDLKSDFDILCAGGELQSDTELCEVLNPDGQKYSVGVTEISCCNHMKSMFKDIKDEPTLADLTAQHADLNSCTGSCMATIISALHVTEVSHDLSDLVAPFQQECDAVAECSYMGASLGFTTNACCLDLTSAADDIRNNPVVEANAARCDDRWGCKVIFELALGYGQEELGLVNVLEPFQLGCQVLDGGGDGGDGGDGSDGSDGSDGGDGDVDGDGGGDGGASVVVAEPGIAKPSYNDLFDALCASSCIEGIPTQECMTDVLTEAADLGADQYVTAYQAIFGPLCDENCLSGAKICAKCEAKIPDTTMLCDATSYVTLTFDGTMDIPGMAVPAAGSELDNLLDVLEEAIKMATGELTSRVEISSIDGIDVTSRRLAEGIVEFQVLVPIPCGDEVCTSAEEQKLKRHRKMNQAMVTTTSADCVSECFDDHINQAIFAVAKTQGKDFSEISPAMTEVFKDAKVQDFHIDNQAEASSVNAGQPDVGTGNGGIQIIDNEGGKIESGAVTYVVALAGVAIPLFM
ncbi:hypothetical protein TrRE_jg10786 [Triparma retinervis]|uniref:Uncharacterized protein n=1 Tax=Triparma retinervis TaxID=2557542 RepID=A0A9W6ZWC2_9STRA|nr:hypothetical protein TrRE_jg10786 [Triparma retinervis]